MDRRTALKGFAAAGLLGGVWATGAEAQPTPVRVRRSISSMARNDPDLEAYRRAIPVLQGWGAWRDQLTLHADMRHRHHSSWRFLPWHRMQLVWFERLVARASGKPDFAMPYWDWDDDVAPAVFFEPGPLSVPGREARPGDRISDFLRRNGQWFSGRITDDFNTFFGRARGDRDASDSQRRYFSGSAEWSGHNLIHGFVGGDMSNLSRSPNDPLFWLHHANIDRIWSIWQGRHPGQVFPSAWRNEQLGGFINPQGWPAPTTTAAATLDTRAFGYTYPADPTPPVFFMVAPGRPIVRREFYSWRMTRTGPGSGFVEISDRLAKAKAEPATGFLEVVPDHEAASLITLVARKTRGGEEVFREAIFLVPMGHSMGPQNYRIQLDKLWDAIDEGVKLEIKASPLEGRRAGPHPSSIVSFTLDARLGFAE